MTRRVMRQKGAQKPHWAYVGNSPMRKVAPPMRVKVTMRVCLRPILSPIWAKKMPPKGLIKKGSEKVRYDSMRAMAGSLVEK